MTDDRTKSPYVYRKQMNVVQGFIPTPKRPPPPHLVVRLATNKISRLDTLTNRATEADLISEEGSYKSANQQQQALLVGSVLTQDNQRSQESNHNNVEHRILEDLDKNLVK